VIIAVIPARGGSKRIAKKNITDFAGKPLIAWSIEKALNTKIFDKVIVSTDSKEIAKVSEKFGAEVPFLRPKNLSDDFTGTSAVISHAVNWHNDNGNYVDFVCCLYATAPLVQEVDILGAYKKLLSSKKSFVFSVTEYPYPIQRAIRLNERNEVNLISPEFKKSRSQDLSKCYHDAGQFYWGKSQAFSEETDFFSPDSLGYLIPSYRVCDIDEPDDLVRAKLLFEVLNRSGEII